MATAKLGGLIALAWAHALAAHAQTEGSTDQDAWFYWSSTYAGQEYVISAIEPVAGEKYCETTRTAPFFLDDKNNAVETPIYREEVLYAPLPGPSSGAACKDLTTAVFFGCEAMMASTMIMRVYLRKQKRCGSTSH